jgi:hypothetical protein
MKRYFTAISALLCAVCITATSFTQSAWQPKNLRLDTRWTKEVSSTNALITPTATRAKRMDESERPVEVKKFGEPGEEILLRAKTVHYYNAQEWQQHAPMAKAYLENTERISPRMSEKCLPMHLIT